MYFFSQLFLKRREEGWYLKRGRGRATTRIVSIVSIDAIIERKFFVQSIEQELFVSANIFALHYLLQFFYTTTFPIIDVFVFCFVFCGSPGLHQRFKTDKICGSDLNKLKYTPMTNSLLVVSFFHFSFHSFFFPLGTPTFPNKMYQKKIWIKLIWYFYFKT